MKQNPVLTGYAAVEAYLPSKEIAIAVVNTYALASFQDSDNPKLASNPSNVVFERIAAKLAPSDAPPTRNSSAGLGGRSRRPEQPGHLSGRLCGRPASVELDTGTSARGSTSAT